MYEIVEWRRGSKMAKFTYTQRRRCSFSAKHLCLSASFCFRETGTGPTQTSNHLSFYMFFDSQDIPFFFFWDHTRFRLSRVCFFTFLYFHWSVSSLLPAFGIISRRLIILASSFQWVSYCSSLSQPLNLGASGTKPVHRVAWGLVTFLQAPSFSL